MEELRIVIWDLLFHAKEPKTIEDIAEALNQDIEAVRIAVNHEWFLMVRDLVSISFND